MRSWGVIGGLAAAVAAGIYVLWGPIAERKKRRGEGSDFPAGPARRAAPPSPHRPAAGGWADGREAVMAAGGNSALL